MLAMSNKCVYHQGPGVFSTNVEPKCSLSCSIPSTQPFINSNHVMRDSRQVTTSLTEPCHSFTQPVLAQSSAIMRGTTTVSLAREHEMRSDLQGLVLTLGGPASGK